MSILWSRLDVFMVDPLFSLPDVIHLDSPEWLTASVTSTICTSNLEPLLFITFPLSLTI